MVSYHINGNVKEKAFTVVKSESMIKMAESMVAGRQAWL